MAFSFGNSKPAAATTTTPTTTGFSFGNTAKPATSNPSTSFSFGNTAAAKPASTGFSFGGSPSTSKPAGGGFSFGNTASVASGGQGNQNAAALNFSFNNIPDKTATPDEKKTVTFNAQTESSDDKKAGLGGQTKPNEKPDPVGILKKNDEDGKSSDPNNKGDSDDKNKDSNSLNSKDGAQKESILEQQIPKEVFEDISKLETHMNDSLNVKSKNIANTTSRSVFDKVQKRINKCNNSVQKLNSSMTNIEHDVNSLVKNLRMIRNDSLIAQKTDGISPAMQFENLAPISYLYKQVERFHASAIEYDRQISELESAMRASASSKGSNSETDNSEEKPKLDLSNLSGEDLIKFLDKFQNSFLKIACQYFSIHNSLQVVKNEYVIYRNRLYGNAKKPLNFSDQSNTASKEAELIASLEDIRVNKVLKSDGMGNQSATGKSPFSSYNTHILANIVKSNITKQLTDPSSVMAQNNNNSTGFGTNKTTTSGFSFGGGGTSSTTNTGGFSFGNTANKTTTSNPTSTGFSFSGFGNNAASKPAAATTSTSSGFSFGGTSAQNKLNTSSASTTGGFSFGNTAASKPAAATTSGFSFGNTASAGATSGFSFGKK